MMLQRKLFARTIAVILSSLMCFPVLAAETTLAKLKTSRRSALDLQMGTGGLVRGKVVTRQGKPVSNVEVQLASKRGNAAKIKSSDDGSFAATGLTAGEYQVRIENQSQLVRIWNAETAPPNAAQAGLFVVGTTVRGQCGGGTCGGCNTCVPASATCCEACDCCDSCGAGDGEFGRRAICFLTTPWVLGVGVAAAIAIPLAVDNDDAS